MKIGLGQGKTMTACTHERLILAMLAGIYKKLGIKDDIDPEIVLSSVFGDKMWGLRWEYGMLYEGTEVDQPPEVKETCDILDMYRAINVSYEALTAADKAKVDTADKYDHRKFEGFDGNNDPHIGVMRYLVDTLGRYTEHKDGVFNSHSMSPISTYRSMLRAIARHDHHHRFHLTVDELIAVLTG